MKMLKEIAQALRERIGWTRSVSWPSGVPPTQTSEAEVDTWKPRKSANILPPTKHSTTPAQRGGALT